MQPQRLIPPPYARHLVPYEGWVHIRCGARGWKAAKWYRERGQADAQSEIVYPGDKSPRLYQWPVKGCAVMVWGREHNLDQCAELVVCLFDAGAAMVVLVHDSLERGWVRYHSDRRPRAA